jgi:hypothetical protein
MGRKSQGLGSSGINQINGSSSSKIINNNQVSNKII